MLRILLDKTEQESCSLGPAEDEETGYGDNNLYITQPRRHVRTRGAGALERQGRPGSDTVKD